MNNKKGITIIALIVTIIVLLILAGFSINLISGNNGLVNRAKQSKQTLSDSQLSDQIHTDLAGYEAKHEGSIMYTELEQLISKYGTLSTVDGQQILTTTDGKHHNLATYLDGYDIFDNRPRLAKDVLASEIGKEVTGYTCDSKKLNKWRLYYADDQNIYLISDKFLCSTKMPLAYEGTNVTSYYSGDDNYEPYFHTTDVYKGSSYIKENSKATKWFKKFLDVYPDVDFKSASIAAYLLDTTSWKEFAGDRAEYCIGTPTLELFCASYKKTHPDKYLECCVEPGQNGYSIKWNTDEVYLNDDEGKGIRAAKITIGTDSNKIYSRGANYYIPGDYEADTRGLYLATPWPEGPMSLPADESYLGSQEAYYISFYSSTIDEEYYGNHGSGVKPIICLKPDVKISDQMDGTLKILDEE